MSGASATACDARNQAGWNCRGRRARRVAGESLVTVGEVDGIDQGRGRCIALIGDDLVAAVVKIEAGEGDNRAERDVGSGGIADGALAGAESPGSQPPVVGEVDRGPCFDVAQGHEGEAVRIVAGVIDDRDVALSEYGGHWAVSSHDPLTRSRSVDDHAAQKLKTRIRERCIPRCRGAHAQDGIQGGRGPGGRHGSTERRPSTRSCRPISSHGWIGGSGFYDIEPFAETGSQARLAFSSRNWHRAAFCYLLPGIAAGQSGRPGMRPLSRGVSWQSG